MSSYNKENPEWIVFIKNTNSRRIELFNIFDHASFREDCNQIFRRIKHFDNEEFLMFEEYIESIIKYYFWCKCEWEIMLSCFPHYEKFKDRKIDVYEQVMVNWDHFIDYLWRWLQESEAK